VNRKRFVALGITLSMLFGAFALTGCGSSGNTTDPGLEGSIDVEGSDTLVNVAGAWADAFMTENPGVMISVKGGGSGTGIAALINGTVDFADASRGIKDEEVQQAEDAGVTPVEHKVAIDGIAVVVNPGNGIGELTMEQLGRIYRGEITNWSELGGADRAIVLLSRDSSSGTYEYFKEEVVASEDENAEYAASAKLLPSNQAIADEVAANEGAVGYIGLGYLTDAVKVVAVDGVKASIETAKDGSYPISRYLYMYSNGELSGVMQAYMEWILGTDGQQIVADEGFVPVQ